MLKYSEITEKLTVKQKAELLSSISEFEKKALIVPSLPSFKVEKLEDLFLRNGLSLHELVRSWDVLLVEETACSLVKKAKAEGHAADAYICPSLKPSMMGTNKNALSEDTFFNKEMLKAFCKGVSSASSYCIIDGFWLTERELSALDAAPNKRFLEETLFIPYNNAMSFDSVIGVTVSHEKIYGAYSKVCSELCGEHADNILGDNQRKFAYITTPDETVNAVLSGSVALDGSAISIENAYTRYCELKRAVRCGECAVYTLEDSINNGEVISESKIDELLEKLIDFVLALKKDFIYLKTEPAAKAEAEEKQESSEAPSTEKEPMATEEAEEANDTAVEEIQVFPELEITEESEIITEIQVVEELMVADEEETTEEQNLGSEQTIAEEASKKADVEEAAQKEAVQEAALKEAVHEEQKPSNAELERIQIEVEPLLVEAALSSAVLLKNESHLLPIVGNTSLALIGNISDDHAINKAFFHSLEDNISNSNRVTEYSAGYEVNGERNDELENDALRAASNANMSILFLTVPEGKRKLPTNQLAILDAFSKSQKSFIAVINCKDVVDVSFMEELKAVVLSPIYTKETAKALAHLLSGKKNFSARLTKSYRENPDEYFARERYYKKARGRKMGIFLDYKRDCGSESDYPFGYGKSYGELKYKSININSGSSPTVTMFNSENFDIFEVVEVYASINKSAVVRPDTELRAFTKVKVKSGTTKSASFNNFNLDTYDSNSDIYGTEKGSYTLCAASCAQNALVKCEHYFNGCEFKEDGELVSDYLENRSNIKDGKYYLEVKITDMNVYKKTTGIAVAGFIAAGILAIIAFAVGGAIGWVLGALGVVCAIFGAYELKRASKQRAFYEKELASQKTHHADATKVNVSSIKALFKEEFQYEGRDEDGNIKKSESEEINIVDVTHDDLSLFPEFLKNSGLTMEKADCSSFMAALASSRVLFAENLSGSLLDKLLSASAEFFGGRLLTETISERYIPESKLLYVKEGDSPKHTSPIKDFIKTASENPEKAHFILLRGITKENADTFLSPYIRYFGNAHSAATLFVLDEENIVLPSNLWFVVEYADKQESVSLYINEVAHHLPPFTISECECECESFNLNITISAFDSLIKKTRSGLSENEELWKKLDGIEDYVDKKSHYSIGNRFFVKIENYFSVFQSQNAALNAQNEDFSADENANTAMDYTLATSIMPALYSAISEADANEVKNLYLEIEHNFGEDKTPICKQMFTKDSET